MLRTRLQDIRLLIVWMSLIRSCQHLRIPLPFRTAVIAPHQAPQLTRHIQIPLRLAVTITPPVGMEFIVGAVITAIIIGTIIHPLLSLLLSAPLVDCAVFLFKWELLLRRHVELSYCVVILYSVGLYRTDVVHTVSDYRVSERQ